MVTPDLESTDPIEQRLSLRGAALAACRRPPRSRLRQEPTEASPPLSSRTRRRVTGTARPAVMGLVAPHAGRRRVQADCPVAAIGVAVAALLIETLLFRALLDVSGLLNLGGQRLAAIGAVLIFAVAAADDAGAGRYRIDAARPAPGNTTAHGAAAQDAAADGSVFSEPADLRHGRSQPCVPSETTGDK